MTAVLSPPPPQPVTASSLPAPLSLPRFSRSVACERVSPACKVAVRPPSSRRGSRWCTPSPSRWCAPAFSLSWLCARRVLLLVRSVCGGRLFGRWSSSSRISLFLLRCFPLSSLSLPCVCFGVSALSCVGSSDGGREFRPSGLPARAGTSDPAPPFTPSHVSLNLFLVHVV